EFGLDDYWAVEIKASRTPTLKKGFHMACDDLKAQRKFVVYTGDDSFPSTNHTTILSLAHFIEELRKKTG
ncbi:MAG: ATPase, partial [SAR116 cluster bacterium]